MISLLLALAGGLGAGTRFVLDGIWSQWIRWRLPVATLIINVVGSFLLGLVTAGVAHGEPDAVRLVVGVGFLGGFTTFSTASVELVRLAREERSVAAVGLAVAMLALAVAAALLGSAIG